MLTKPRPTTSPPSIPHHAKKRGRPPVWRNPWVLVTLVVVVVAVAVIAAVGNARQDSTSPSSSPSAATGNRTLIDAVTKLDPAVVGKVGSGGLPMTFTPLGSGAAPLTGATGKPEIFYVGADYCPYCAAQRWSMVVALSRFGSFQHLYLTRSSSSDVYPDTATFTFRGGSYTSDYLDFVAVETADRTGQPQQTLTPDQRSVFSTYSVPPYVPANAAAGIPWLDIANRYVMVSSGFSPAVLQNLSWAQISEKLGNADDPVTRGIVGNADNITAAICVATGMKPASVCSAAPIATLVSQLR